MELSVIIPACNEEMRIKETLQSYVEFLRTTGLSFEIIVEMDGCTDRTPQIVDELSRVYPEIRSIEFEERLGKGGGLIQGFRLAKGGYVGFVDADGSTGPKEMMKLLNEVKNGTDCVIASRRLETSVVVNQTKARKILSKCFNLMVRLLFDLPYHDTQCGAKMYKKEALDKLISDIHVNGFVFDVVLLYLTKKKGFSIKEVGITWENKAGSKVNILHTTMDMFISIIKLRLYFSPLRRLMVTPSPHIRSAEIIEIPRI